MKTKENKVKILNENVDKHVDRQKSKARNRVWIVQTNIHIAET